MAAPLHVAVLASGEGTTFEGLVDALRPDAERVRVVLLVADRPGAPVLERAERLGVPVLLLPSRGPESSGWSDRLTAELDRRGVGLVVLAGFLAFLPPSWVERWRGRALNIHPSLLPRHGGRGMFGRHVHEAVIASGDRETGVTIHLVTGDLDSGPPVVQRRVAVDPNDTPDTLRARVHPVEVDLLAQTVRRFASGELPLPYPRAGERPDPARRA